MINVSSEYKNIIKDSREFKTKIKVTLVDGTILNFDNDSIMSGGLTINDATSDESSLSIGSAIINSATIKLDNFDGHLDNYDFINATVVVEVGLQLSTTVEYLKKGTYTVDDSNSIGSVIILDCLDNMHKFDKPFSEVDIVFPTTALGLLQAITTHCGVPNATSTFLNWDIVIDNRPIDEAITCREVISWIAQLSGNFARCNVDGALELNWYDFTKFESELATENDYHTITEISSGKFGTEDIVITGIQVSYEDTESEEKKETKVLSGTSGYILEMSNNPLIQNNANATTIANSVGSKIIGMKFRTVELSIISDPSIEAGDIAYVHDYKGNVYQTILTNVKYSISEFQSLICGADSPNKNSSVRYSVETKSYVENRQQIKNELNSYDISVQQLNNLVTNGFGVHKSKEVQDDGSIVYYMHDKPLLEDSQTIWKQTRDVFAVSVDGGNTYTSGFDSNGNAVMNVLNAIGINADWVKSGILMSQDGSTWINLNDGTFNLGDKLKLDDNGFFMEISNNLISEIDSVKTYADTKASEAEQSAKSYAEAKANEAEQASKAYTDALEIGGRNLILKSDVKKTSSAYAIATYNLSEDWELGQTYTITIKGDINSGQVFGIWANGVTTRVTVLEYDSDLDLYISTFTPTSINSQTTKQLRVHNYPSAGAEFAEIEWIKLEKGNKPTDWTPAPEDIDEKINVVDTKYSNKVAEINTTIDGITQRVGSTETNITTINGTVSSLSTRMNVAEQKITPEAIVSTVTSSSKYTDDLSGKVSSSTIISSINQSAEEITINANKLTIGAGSNFERGEVYTWDEHKGKTWAQVSTMSDGGTWLEASRSPEYSPALISRVLEKISASLGSMDYFDEGAFYGETIIVGGFLNTNLIMANSIVANHIASGAITADKLNVNSLSAISSNIGTITGGTINSTDFIGGSITTNVGNIGGWNIAGYGLYNDTLRTGFLTHPDSALVLYVGNMTYSGMIENIGEGGDDFLPHFYVSKHGDVYGQSLIIDGSKNRVVTTKNYGKVLLNAYETPRPIFADSGHGIISEDGFCYVDIDSIFYETIDTTHDYTYFLTKYGKGDLWIRKDLSTKEYFVVEGTPNLEFSWKIEAIQRDYNTYNMERYEPVNNKAEIDYVSTADEYLATL